MERLLLSYVVIVCLLTALRAEGIKYSGTVSDGNGNPVGMARVEVAGTRLHAYSDEEGAFVLEGEIEEVKAHSRTRHTTENTIGLINKTLLINGQNDVRGVSVALFSPDGKKLLQRRLKTGVRTVDLSRTLRRNGLYILKVISVNNVATYRFVYCQYERKLLSHPAAVRFDDTKNISAAEESKTFLVEAPGYYPEQFVRDGETVDGLELVVEKQHSDTMNTFQRFFTGNGTVRNLRTGERITVPEERRIHVILFPEGYTSDEYAEGKYVRDCLSWYRSVFAFAPMLFFRECFVIWRYPVVSSEYVNSNGVADTWFRLRLSGGGMTSELETATAKIWGLMDEFPFPPEQFYGGRGLTAGRARNVIAQMLVFDQSSDKAWFSGIATSLQNPVNQQEMIGIALAQDQQHEFMHVLAFFLDEYYDAGHSPLQSILDGSSSGYLTNVAPTDACDDLPWKHLIYGKEYNPDVDSLVGAFGANGRYHSELYCLMNGSHDNKTLFGGNGQLRVYDRLCNFCRELAAFRMYERIGILDDDATSWDEWIAEYRALFYEEFPFYAPDNVPQRNSDREPQWFGCGE